MNALAYSGSIYVTAGVLGKVATSADGVTWTLQTGLSSTAWGTSDVKSITWDGSQFVAVGLLGKAATSPDGVTWTFQPGLALTGFSTATANAVIWDGVSKVLTIGGSAKAATL